MRGDRLATADGRTAALTSSCSWQMIRHHPTSDFRMTTRRTFVSSMIGAGLTLPSMRPTAFRSVFEAGHIAGTRTPAEMAEDETYWREIQRAFDLDRTVVNLNNGGCSPAPTHVIDQMMRDI